VNFFALWMWGCKYLIVRTRSAQFCNVKLPVPTEFTVSASCMLTIFVTALVVQISHPAFCCVTNKHLNCPFYVTLRVRRYVVNIWPPNVMWALSLFRLCNL